MIVAGAVPAPSIVTLKFVGVPGRAIKFANDAIARRVIIITRFAMFCRKFFINHLDKKYILPF
jgi:hypothetical protein